MTDETVKELLKFIPAGLPWGQWRAVMSAVREALGNESAAAGVLEAWDPCDKKSGSYAAQLRTLSIRTSPGYLVNLAKKHGYIPRPRSGVDRICTTITVVSRPHMTNNGNGFVFDAKTAGGKYITAWASVANAYGLEEGQTVAVAGTPKKRGNGIFFLIDSLTR